METRYGVRATPIGMRQRSPRRGTRSEQVLRAGPFVLCVMLGTQGGRWHAELMSGASAAAHGRQLLCQPHGVTELAEDAFRTPATLGIAVLTNWRFVNDSARHEHSWVRI